MSKNDDQGKHKGHEGHGGHAGGMGHTPPARANPKALGWHHFHRPPGADERGAERLAKLKKADPKKPKGQKSGHEAGHASERATSDPDRAPLVCRDENGKLTSPLTRGEHDSLLDLLFDIS